MSEEKDKKKQWDQHFNELPVLSEEYDSTGATGFLEWLVSRQIFDQCQNNQVDTRFPLCRGGQVEILVPIDASIKLSSSQNIENNVVCVRNTTSVVEDALAGVKLVHHNVIRHLASYRVVFKMPLAVDSC